MQTDAIGQLPYVDGSHRRNDTYQATFDTKTIYSGVLTLHFEARIFNEETAVSLFDRVSGDCTFIGARLDVKPDAIALYIVDKNINGSMFAKGNTIYCTIADIMTGSYRQVLVSAYFSGLLEPWQTIGLVGCIWGSEPDSQAIREYYSIVENISILSMFPAYFCEAFADATMLYVAKNTAISVTEFILMEHSIDVFLGSGDSAEYRQDWLSHMDIDAEYKAPFDLSYLDGAAYSTTSGYPFTVTIRNHYFHFKPAERAFETPEDIMRFLVSFKLGTEEILSFIKDNAPLSYPRIMDSWNKNLYIYCGEDQSSGDPTTRRINIGRPTDVWHETIHVLFSENDSSYIWLSEGLATYFSLVIEKKIKDTDMMRNRFAFIQIEAVQQSIIANEIAFIELVQDYYHNRAGLPGTIDDFDLELFFEAIASVSLKHTELLEGIFPLANRSVARAREFAFGSSLSLDEDNGNHLTYPESLFFTKYLFETHGMDTVVCAYLDSKGFEEAFGVSLEVALNDFIDNCVQRDF